MNTNSVTNAVADSAARTVGHRRTSHRVALCAAVSVGLLAMATSASAAGSEAGSANRQGVASVSADDGLVVIDDGLLLPEDGDGGMVDIMPIDPAQANAEQDALAEYLAEHGIEFTVVTDGEWHWVEIDWEDASAQAAVEDFYWERYPTPQEVIDQINADNEELAQYLRDHGIEVTITTDRHGMTMLEWDWDDPAVQEVVDDFYWEKYPMPQDVIDQISAEAQALVDFLRGKGIDATVVLDRHGLATAEYDWEDPAVQEALAEFWREYRGDFGDVMPVPMPLLAEAAGTDAAVAVTVAG